MMRTAVLQELFQQTAALFHRLRVSAERVHQDGPDTAGRRGILRSLDAGGPQTVPQLARARPVSRQRVQVLVNGLLADGWVEMIPNPAHRRSGLVSLTRRGQSRLAAMLEREEALIGTLPITASGAEIAAAAETLRSVRAALEKIQ